MTMKETRRYDIEEWLARQRAMRTVRANVDATPEQIAKLKEIDECVELAQRAIWCRDRLLDELVRMVESPTS